MYHRCKRLAALLLCVILLAGMAVMPGYAADAHDHDHEGAVISAVTAVGPEAVFLAPEDTDPQPDGPSGVPSGECPNGGSHNWVLRDGKPGTVCSAVTVGTIACSKCGTERGTTVDEHLWGNWETTPATCDQDGSRTHNCTRCGKKETETLPRTGHKLVDVTVTANCEKGGESYQRCTACSYETPHTTTSPTGHQWTDDGDCRTAPRCSVCGARQEGTYPAQHKFGGTWYFDDNGHWQQCQNAGCNATSAHEAHRTTGGSGDCTKGASCSVCGDGNVTGRQHDFANGKVGISIASGHYMICANPGCSVTTLVGHTAGSGSSCTDAVKCTVCGYTMSGGKSHIFGSMSQGDSLGHTRTCTACGYVERTSHTGDNDDSDCTTPIKCSTCGYVLVQGYSGHDYNSTVWHDAGASGHYTTCAHPGCKFSVTEGHKGGTATCSEPAICSVCGAGYGSASSGSHSGGTEIRNAKTAAVGVEGYTGDTYCLGCGQKISSGSTIPALTADHTHSYGANWQSDSTSHWHVCSCGDKKDSAAHTFKDGKCTVCGEADPNYKPAEEHIHTYDGKWSGDSQEHWHECTACGEQADRGTHIFLNDVCIECGMTFEQHEEEEKKEQEQDSAGQDGEEPGSETILQFNDVPANAWYYVEASWGVQAGVVEGTGNGDFSPDRTCREDEILTFLWRALGKPEANIANPFSDISEDDWFYGAALWAYEQGIIDASFSRTKECTRSTAVTFMWKAAGSPANSGKTDFTDMSSDAAYAQAVAWALGKGITTGTGDGTTFSPAKTCSRAEIVTFLYRAQ